jgi:hypothetical protein
LRRQNEGILEIIDGVYAPNFVSRFTGEDRQGGINIARIANGQVVEELSCSDDIGRTGRQTGISEERGVLRGRAAR